MPSDVLSTEFNYQDLVLACRKIEKLEAEVARLEAECGSLRSKAPMRSSIEVLQRMANGLDPFDAGRFKCAVAALPHEAPKLSASVSMIGAMGIGAQMDAALRRRKDAERRGPGRLSLCCCIASFASQASTVTFWVEALWRDTLRAQF